MIYNRTNRKTKIMKSFSKTNKTLAMKSFYFQKKKNINFISKAKEFETSKILSINNKNSQIKGQLWKLAKVRK